MTQGISILMYHQVGPFRHLTAPMKAHRSTYCRVDRFADQMAWLHRFDYRVLSMDEVLACVRGERPVPARAVALTFDDGYESFHEHAWPILQRYGFPAMVYLVAGMLGESSSWFARDGRDTPPLMSAARIRQLRREGCDFGAHSMTHVRLAEQSAARMRAEVGDSKARLEDVLGERVQHFCYPYGSHDARTVDAVSAAGYACAATCVRATATPADDPLTLPRKAVSHGDSLLGVLWKLHMKNEAKTPSIRRAAFRPTG